MKTIALTLFAAALGCAQDQPILSPPPTEAPAPKAAPKTAPTSPESLPILSPAATDTPAPKAAPKSTPKAAPKPTPTAQKKKPVQPATPPKGETKSEVQSIPPGATLVEPNLYRYTDSSGKTWNYRQTPFGISRWEETSAPAPQPNPQATSQSTASKSDQVVVTDLGDSYRFEKKTPFGTSSWVRKKSELTDEEVTLTGGHAESNPNQNSVNSKPAGNQ